MGGGAVVDIRMDDTRWQSWENGRLIGLARSLEVGSLLGRVDGLPTAQERVTCHHCIGARLREEAWERPGGDEIEISCWVELMRGQDPRLRVAVVRKDISTRSCHRDDG